MNSTPVFLATLAGKWPLLIFATCIGAPAQAGTAETRGDSVWERVSLEGDLRLRYESIREEPGADDDRSRYRLRFGMSTELTDAVEFGFRFATGKGDPASANLNFGESFDLSNLRVDLAYLGWSASESVEVIVGKMKKPFVRVGDNALMWDSDLNPEGFAAKVESGVFFGRTGAFLLDWRADGIESWLYAAQAGAVFDVSDSSTLRAGVGWFDYTDIAGNTPLYDDDALGNSLDPSGRYLNDYDIVEVFSAYAWTIGNLPVVVFGEWARNTRAATAETAYVIGVNVGKAEGAKTAEWSWEWRDTEADALLGTLTDSDLADGMTDSRGHVFKGTYMLTNHVGLGGTLIFSEYGQFNGSPMDFDRLMLDVEFIF